MEKVIRIKYITMKPYQHVNAKFIAAKMKIGIMYAKWRCESLYLMTTARAIVCSGSIVYHINQIEGENVWFMVVGVSYHFIESN